MQEIGSAVLPALLELYRGGDTSQRVKIAHTFYWLGWKSEEAKELLFEDVHTDNAELRLAVQWALGRVSANEEVVKRLLDNMTTDANPLFSAHSSDFGPRF